MYLVVDAQALQAADVRNRGIGRYTGELIHALSAARPGWRIEAVVNAAMPLPEPQALGESIPLLRFDPLLPLGPSSADANERYFGDWLSTLGAEAVLEPNFFEGEGLVPQFTGSRPRLAGVAYDLIPLLFHERYLATQAARRKYARRLRQFVGADVILAISEATRHDVIRLLRRSPSDVVTILGGAGHASPAATTGRPDEAATLARLAIDRPFLLCVGGADPRKNVSGALAAYAALPADVRSSHLLVIVCALSPDQAAALTAEADWRGVKGALRLTGFVDDEQLGVLYRRCRLLFFPSYYEGLGLPVLEALEAGAPVVASNRSSIPEFAGEMSWLADPSSPGDLAAAIGAALAEPRDARLEARRRFAAGFTWVDVADRAAAAIEHRATSRDAHRRGRPRIAWVSPLPPARSGISDYSAELVERLARHIDIELVIGADTTTTPDLASRFQVVRASQVEERHERAPYDLFVYQVGNSDHHVYMLDLISRHPGLLVLHDIHLGGLALRARGAGRWPGNLPAEIEREGATELAEELRRGEGDHRRIDGEVGLYGSLAAASAAVVVHSAWSWRHVRAVTDAPVFRIAQGIPRVRREPAATVRTRIGLTPGAFVVVTLGEVTRAKQPERLIRACAQLPAGIRERLQLVVAGEIAPAFETELTELAAQRGIGGQIRFEGRVPMDRLNDLGPAADACVQLRFPVRGETSAALLRALAAGSACIVSDAGSFAELPDDVCLRVAANPDSIEELTAALVRLHDEPGLRERLKERSSQFASDVHDLDAAARAYAAAIRLTIARNLATDASWTAAAGGALATAEVDPAIRERKIQQWAALRLARRPA